MGGLFFAESGVAQEPVHVTEISAADPTLPGGNHQIGVWGGFSLHSGHYLGFDKGVNFFPFDVRYSYRFALFPHFVVRYSPEATLFAVLDEPNQPTWAPTNPTTPKRLSKGGGLSPVGFELDLRPRSRIQPFFTENSGIIYFNQRVLSPDGSQLLFSTDLGLGINFFPKLRQGITVGYRYQHMSNADISVRNPGTDANTFYLGVSRFHTKDVK
jgi:hypothetical protein